MKRWKKIFQANGNKKKASEAVLILDKIDFKTRTITKYKEEHYTMIKFNPRRGYNICKYLYTQHKAFKYIKQILIGIKGEIDINTIIVRNFNIPLNQWINHPENQ